jgi:hypothetical protein
VLKLGGEIGGTIMWLFIAAAFLVAAWLLYRWPRQTLQGVVIVLGLIALFAGARGHSRCR